MTAPRLAEARWPDLAERRPVLVVPVGSTEQHGPHLPCDTDTRIASAVAHEAVGRLTADDEYDVVLAPAVSFGASGEHEGFAGTVSIGHEALATVLVELGRSASRWASAVVFVNGHGGNVPALVRVVDRLTYEGRQASWVPCVVEDADAHAGCTETSLLLHLAPHSVGARDGVTGCTEPLADLWPTLRDGGVRAVSASGILGDPRQASAEEGQRIFVAMVARVERELRSVCETMTHDQASDGGDGA